MTRLEDVDQNAAPDALMARSEASEWIIARRASPTWTDQDQVALDNWLSESSANLLAYWRLEAAWDQAQRLTALRRPIHGPVVSSGYGRARKIVVAVATLIVVAIFGTLSAAHFRHPAGKTYATPVGGRLTIALADGSKIELNTNTALWLADNANARSVILEKGEAYFQIRHDATHPFELSVGGHRIIDLGTKFSVRAEPNRLEVALIEGSAKIESDGRSATSRAAVLRPGDVAIATSDSLAVSRRSVADLADSLAWRHDLLAFKYATLAEAASEFNRYNNTKIIIHDPRVAKLTIYGTFPTRDVAAFVDAAQVSFKLHVRYRNGEFVVSR